MRSTLALHALPILLCVFLLGCGSSVKHYMLAGQVISKVPETHTLVVDHQEVPGFMPAMTMPYPVAAEEDISKVEPGDYIRARIVVKPDQSYALDKIQVTDSSHRGPVVQPAKSLFPGEQVPDVALLNQDGKTVRLSDFRGKTLLLTFIYTRCPLPNFCLRISSQFAALNRELAKDPQSHARTELLSISIDPTYDTPSVLHKYGLAYLNEDPKGFEHWQFAVPSPENLRKLADAFGLLYEEENNQISHSMSTVLVDSDGRMVQEWTTNEWTTVEVLAAIRKVEHAST
ncbi:MAG TPA: SCO family protein [Candidatus Micrarchaeia archaeon]|nr:SCO family protein [Candidatus Micrarchaeia archaeon]